MLGGRITLIALWRRVRLLAGCVVVAACTAPVLQAETKPEIVKGEAALAAKDFDAALQIFSDVIKADPGCVAGYVGRGHALYEKHEYEQAIADFSEALRRDAKAKEALWRRFFTYVLLHEYQKAAGDADALIELEPNDGLNYRLRAGIRKELRDYAAALSDIECALKLGDEREQCVALRGDILRDAKSYREAIQDYSTVISAKGKAPEYLARRAKLYQDIGSFREAAEDYEKALRFDGDNSNCCNSFAWMLAVCPDPKILDGKRAVELAMKGCELSKWLNSSRIDTLAAAYARVGDFPNAVNWQKKAIDLCKANNHLKGFNERLALYQQQKAFVEESDNKEAVAWSNLRSESFDAVWNTVNENYFDPTFGGVNWSGLREKYRLRLWEAVDKRSLGRLLQDMLNELKRTHFAIIPREMSVLTPEERGRIGSSGAVTAVVENEIVVVRVKPGSPAASAGIKPGDIVRRVDKYALSEILASMGESVGTLQKRLSYLRGYVGWWLSAPVGRKVDLQLEGADGKLRDVSFTTVAHEGLWSEASGSSPSEPLDFDVQKSKSGVVYMRFSSFALPMMTEFKRMMRGLGEGDCLLLDLRGNGGGVTLMAAGITGRLVEKEYSLGTLTRRYSKEDFLAYPQRAAFRGPVAVLVDSGSASTSEILAAGLQEIGRARLFGENTAGAALPSLFRKLPTGDLLQYAIADIKTPKGTLIEGNGVTPDETVTARRVDYVAGRDVVREAAERWLAVQTRGGRKGGAGK